MATIESQVDIIVTNHGSIFLVDPRNVLATDWLKENVQEGAQHLGKKLAVEHRFIADLVNGMRNDGLVVEVLT